MVAQRMGIRGLYSGSPAAIEKLQRGPYHNFQRVDAPHVEVNPLATALKGWAAHSLWRRGGLLVETSLSGSSPGFDVNDSGFQGAYDVWGATAKLTWAAASIETA